MSEQSGTPIRRFKMWCSASHGHDLLEDQDGSLVLYADHECELSVLQQQLKETQDKIERMELAEPYATRKLLEAKLARYRAAEAKFTLAEAVAEAIYRQGFIDGIAAYAWHKDGVQYVGTTGTTRKEAVTNVEKTWNYSPPSMELVLKSHYDTLRARYVELEAKMRDAAKDAEVYRWLLEDGGRFIIGAFVDVPGKPSAEQRDFAIRAAYAAAKRGEL